MYYLKKYATLTSTYVHVPITYDMYIVYVNMLCYVYAALMHIVYGSMLCDVYAALILVVYVSMVWYAMYTCMYACMHCPTSIHAWYDVC